MRPPKQKFLWDASESGWIPLERGAPQGEVMSPSRFTAWINLLMEVLYEKEGIENAIRGKEGPYDQAFCHDG